MIVFLRELAKTITVLGKILVKRMSLDVKVIF